MGPVWHTALPQSLKGKKYFLGLKTMKEASLCTEVLSHNTRRTYLACCINAKSTVEQRPRNICGVRGIGETLSFLPIHTRRDSSGNTRQIQSLFPRLILEFGNVAQVQRVGIWFWVQSV